MFSWYKTGPDSFETFEAVNTWSISVSVRPKEMVEDDQEIARERGSLQRFSIPSTMPLESLAQKPKKLAMDDELIARKHASLLRETLANVTVYPKPADESTPIMTIDTSPAHTGRDGEMLPAKRPARSQNEPVSSPPRDGSSVLSQTTLFADQQAASAKLRRSKRLQNKKKK